MTDFTADEILAKTGPIEPFTPGLPGAWWVGTDLAKQRADSLDSLREKRRDSYRTICDEFDLDFDTVWVWGDRQKVSGVVPADKDNPPSYLRLNRDGHGYVPDRRRKEGKRLAAALRKHDADTAYNVQDVLSGLQGEILRPVADFRHLRSGFGIRRAEGYYPYAFLKENPDDNPHATSIKVDPELWQRVPVSILAQIVEKGTPE